MDGRLAVLSVSFVVLSVFMSVPQPGAGVLGQTDGNTGNTHHHTNEIVDARPNINCLGHAQHASPLSCQNLAVNSINNISSQIKMELEASQTYMSMAAYFGRDDVAYRGFAKFFMKASDEEREHATKFIEYLNKRGGYVKIKGLDAPAQEWAGPLGAVTAALELERLVNAALLDLHWEAQQKNDPHLQDFIESEYLIEQVDSIRELSSWKTILTRLQDNPLGLHQFDEELWNGARG